MQVGSEGISKVWSVSETSNDLNNNWDTVLARKMKGVSCSVQAGRGRGGMSSGLKAGTEQRCGL